MTIMQKRLPFIVVMLLGVGIVAVSIYDVIYEKDWFQEVIAGYAILILFAIVLLATRMRKKSAKTIEDVVGEFEKTLHGGLYHFKCPSCNGIFALKKSKPNNKKPVKMTCPDCGGVGMLPSVTTVVEAEIPEKKSINANFRCKNCGEGLMIWAEGKELYPVIQVYSCPYCGIAQTMKQV